VRVGGEGGRETGYGIQTGDDLALEKVEKNKSTNYFEREKWRALREDGCLISFL